jgi:hypothetical protein
MANRPFEELLEGDPPLLHQVERLVVEAHRHWYESAGGQNWSEPKAYHWLHYEDPNPIARLAEGVQRMSPHIEADENALAKLERLTGRGA